MSEEQTDFKPKSLDDLLVNDTEPEPKAEEPKPEASDAKDTKEEKGEPEPAPEKEPSAEQAKEDAPPAPEEKAKPTVPQAALLDERRKRQGLESKVAKLEEELGELKKSPRPDPIDDPEGAAEYDRKEQQLRDVKAEEREWKLLVKVDRRAMQRQHDDYDEIEAIFMAEAQSNQALAVEFSQSEYPAEFAYTEGKRLQQVRAMGNDPAAYIQAQVEEGVKKALEALNKEPPAKVPESLAEAPSATNKEVKEWQGPTPIGEILKG